MAQRDGPRRLTLGRDRKIAGVCGGIAEYFDLDPTVVRIVFVLLVLFPFLPLAGGLLLYVALWLIMPESAPGDEPASAADYEQRAPWGAGPGAGIVFGGLIVLLGLMFLFQRAFSFLWPGWWTLHIGIFFWPLLLVAIGAVIMAAAMRKRG